LHNQSVRESVPKSKGHIVQTELGKG
jgi:hypothetical protein